MYIVACASSAWSSSKPTRFTSGPAAAVDDTTAAALESSPAYQAAKRSGEALPKLRLLRQLLGVHDAAAVLHHPRFWSMPLEKDLLPRHAYQVSLGAPATTSGCPAALEQLLLAKDAHFVEGLASKGLEGATAEGYADFAAAFRRGGIDAAREGRADLLELALSHGWDPNEERDVRGASALHYAAGHGHAACVEVLLRRGGLSVNDEASGDGATPLHWAVAGTGTKDHEAKGSVAHIHPGAGGGAWLPLVDGLLAAVLPRVLGHNEARVRLEEVGDHDHVPRRQLLQRRLPSSKGGSQRSTPVSLVSIPFYCPFAQLLSHSRSRLRLCISPPCVAL